jgi:hypothetical protein
MTKKYDGTFTFEAPRELGERWYELDPKDRDLISEKLAATLEECVIGCEVNGLMRREAKKLNVDPEAMVKFADHMGWASELAAASVETARFVDYMDCTAKQLDANAFSGAGCDASTTRPDFGSEAKAVKRAADEVCGQSQYQQIKESVARVKAAAMESETAVFTSVQNNTGDKLPEGALVAVDPGEDDIGLKRISRKEPVLLDNVKTITVTLPEASDWTGSPIRIGCRDSQTECVISGPDGEVIGRMKSRDLGDIQTPILMESWEDFTSKCGEVSMSSRYNCPCGESLTDDDKSPNDDVITCWKCGWRYE